MTRVRIDKWLWAARFFKSRALASRACELGRIECNGQRVKPSREIQAGDRLQVTNDGGTFEIEIMGLSEMRGPATVAQALYQESEASKQARLQLAQERKAMPRIEALASGKPSKRERRRFDEIRRRG